MDKGVIPASVVRRIEQPVLVDCGSPQKGDHQGTLVVVPLMEGEQVAGLEIRCSCGSRAMVECVYPQEEAK